MTEFLWETHMHTAEASLCGRDTAADMARACHAKGYAGIIVTDHFLNSNNVMAGRRGSWQWKIDGTLQGYRLAKAQGEALGMHVFLGIEYTYEGGDFLTFGITEAFLRDQPDLCDIPLEAYVERVHGAGGFISQAHPFREGSYLPAHVEKRWDLVDALEVRNGSHRGRELEWDRKAKALAERHGLLETAGSDAHSVRDVGGAGLVLYDEVDTIEDWICAVKGKRSRMYAPGEAP